MSAVETRSRTDREDSDRTTAAYDSLRRLILHGRLAPGSRIVETEVATKLGVSRTTVRAAVQRLHQEGFIIARKDGERARPVVSPLTRDDARDIFQIVGALEALAAASVARLEDYPRAEVVRNLEAANLRLAGLQAMAYPDSEEFFQLDRAFHSVSVDVTARHRLAVLHAIATLQAERYMRLYVSHMTGKIQASVEEHEKIVDAIRRGDPDLAQAAVLANWRNAAQRLERVIDSVGERGSW